VAGAGGVRSTESAVAEGRRWCCSEGARRRQRGGDFKLGGVATGGRRPEGCSGSGVGCGQIDRNDFRGGERGYCCSNFYFRVIFLPGVLQTPLCL
jgi:hypothetical protein